MISPMVTRLAIVAALVPAAAAAQTPPPAPAAAPVVDATAAPAHDWRDRLVVDGMIDAYAAYQVGGAGADTLPDRRFEDVVGGFALAFAKLGVGVRPEPVGLRLDLGFGRVQDRLAAATALAQTVPDVEGVRQLEQAYVTFAVPTRLPLAIDVGKFIASAGAEAIESNRNWAYTRSYLFSYAIPYTHTGLRLTLAPAPGLTLAALVVNGWDCVIDNNGAKTYGLVASYTAPTGTTIALTGLAGIETVGASPPWRLLADLVVAQTLGRLGLVLNATVAREGAARWYGAAGYARVAIATHFNLALRGEVFVDHGGRIVANQNTRVEEVTLTAGFPIGKTAELRAEARADFSDPALFVVDAELKAHQVELLAAALAWF
jgi:hypothetical protein